MKRIPLLFIIVVLIGCGKSGSEGSSTSHVPVIFNLRLSPSSTSQNSGGGKISVNFYFDYSDSGSDLKSFTINCYESSGASCGTLTSDFSSQSSSNGSATISLAVDTTTVGSYDAELYVTDSQGSDSNILKDTFSII